MNNKELRTYICKKRIFHRHTFRDSLPPIEYDVLIEYKDKLVQDKERWRWYSNVQVLFEIAKALKHREANFQIIEGKKQPIRWLKIHSFDYLIYNFFSYQFLERPYTLHRSLAVYKDMPKFPDGGRRGDVIRKEWTQPKKYLESGIYRDIGFDIDSGYDDAKKLFNLLNEFNVRFSVWSSGKKGFHFILTDSPQLENIKRTSELNEAIANDIMDHIGISIDTVPASIPIAYFKCPYSIDGRNNRVILPLTKEQFLNFDMDMIKIDNVLKNINIRNRGLVVNNDGNIDNVKKLIEAI